MDHLTASRRWTALLALALGGFAIGLTEFVAMGLLPDIATLAASAIARPYFLIANSPGARARSPLSAHPALEILNGK